MNAVNTGAAPAKPPKDDRPVGELVHQLSEQTSTLIRQELALAQLEMQQKGKRAAIGAGMFGGAGLVAVYGLGALTAAAILALATAVEPWAAALIVAGALFLVAGVLSLVGRKEVDQATPPVPEHAIASTKTDVETVKRKAARA